MGEPSAPEHQVAPAPPEPAAAPAALRREPRVISVRTLVAAALIVLAVVALFYLLSSILGIVLTVLVAIVFAEGIRPLVHRLRTRGVPVPLGILIVYIVLLAAVTLMIIVLVQPIISEAQSLADHFPTYRDQFLSFFTHLENQFHFNVDVSKQVGDVLSAAQNVLITIGTTIFGIVVDFILVLVLGFLWLVSSDRLKHFVVDLMPLHRQDQARDVIQEIGFRMGGYLRAVAINSLAVGVATGLVAWGLRLPSPVLLGVFAGVTAAIPLVGPFIGMVPPVLLAFTISPTWPILVLVVMLVVQLIDANTVVPLVMNRVVALPPLAVVLALLIGGALQGLIGALLAVPIAAALHVVILRVLVPAVHAAQGRELATTPALQAAPPRSRAAVPGTKRFVPRLRRPKAAGDPAGKGEFS